MSDKEEKEMKDVLDNMDEFLPQDYKVPETDGNYMKFKEGENQFRIMSGAIKGWELWIDNQPKRYKEDEEIPLEDQESADIDSYTGEPRPAKHFMSFVVWNRNAEPKPKLQILHLTQNSIKKELARLNRSKAWGNPIGTDGYDILVEKEGEGLETRYSVTPAKPEKLDKEIVEAYKEANINLHALFKNEDPFAG
jgi:hypothetical protein